MRSRTKTTDHPKDICACGDYRSQHRPEGPCKFASHHMSFDLKYDRCERFKLSQRREVMEPCERSERLDAKRLVSLYWELKTILTSVGGVEIAGMPKIPKYCDRAQYLRLSVVALKRAIQKLTPDWNPNKLKRRVRNVLKVADRIVR